MPLTLIFSEHCSVERKVSLTRFDFTRKKINLGSLNHVVLFLVYAPFSQYSKDYGGQERKSMLGGGIKVSQEGS